MLSTSAIFECQYEYINVFTSRPFLKNGGRYCFGVRRRIRRLSPSPPSPRMFCLISRLLLMLAF